MPKNNCYNCDNMQVSRLELPCNTCVQTTYVNWKPKESPAWKQYVQAKVEEQMVTLYKAFEKVPQGCQQARFIKGLDAPKTCDICKLGPCPHNISIK